MELLFCVSDRESKAKTNKATGKGKGKKKKRNSSDMDAKEDSDDGDYEGIEVDYMSDESRSVVADSFLLNTLLGIPLLYEYSVSYISI